jgi:hypothetical protein
VHAGVIRSCVAFTLLMRSFLMHLFLLLSSLTQYVISHSLRSPWAVPSLRTVSI